MQNTVSLISKLRRGLILALLLTIIIAIINYGIHHKGRREEPASGVAAQTTESFSKQGPTNLRYVQFLDRSHWIVADSNRVWRTEDGGQKWILSHEIETRDDHVRIGGLSFINDATGFLILDKFLLRTNDGGRHWSNVASVNFEALNCYFLDALHGWAGGYVWQEGFVNNPKIPMYVGGIWATKDGGQTWWKQRVQLPQEYFGDGGRWGLNDIFFSNQNVGWAVGDGVILWTVDGGENWRVAESNKAEYKQVRFFDEQFGWATWPALSITTDRGKHWKLLDEPTQYGTWPLIVVFLSRQHGFAASLDLFETKDGGQNWKKIRDKDEAPPCEYIGRALDGTLIILGLNLDQTVVSQVSTDGGVTWQVNNWSDGKQKIEPDLWLSMPALRKSEAELLALAEHQTTPEYPVIARAARAGGDVVVEILIDEQGNVTAARVLSGHPLLRDAAIKAAQEWKFGKTVNEGRATKVIGTLTFKFN